MSRLRLSHFVAVFSASGLLFGIVGTAHADLVDFNGTLSIGLVGLPPIVGTGTGQALLNSSAGPGNHLTTLQILTNTISTIGAIVPITDPFAVPIVSVRGTAALGTGILRPFSAMAAGLTQNVMPVKGIFRVCILLVPGCPSSLPIPLTGAGRFTPGPAGVGIGGLITVGTFAKAGIKFSIYHQPWTVGTASVKVFPTPNGGLSSPFVQGFVHGPASATSSTADTSGVVKLVTATRVVSTFGVTQVTPLFTTLRIHFVPEPGTLVLLVAGVAGLLVIGRHRARR